jgi:putative acetyltransferase
MDPDPSTTARGSVGPRELPPGLHLRRQERADDDAVRQVVTEAFGDPDVEGLALALAALPGSAGFLAWARSAGEEVAVGHVGLSRGWVDARERLVDVLVLSPLSVVPTWQRRGVGRALVAAAVEEATAAGAPLLFLEGDPAYYARVGFSPAVPLGFTPPSNRIPEPAFQVVVLPGYEPWMTGALVYCDVFWQYDCVGLREDDPRWPGSS